MNSQPTFGREDETKNDGRGDRHQDEDHQRIGREQRDPPILVIAKAHLLVAEKLMMIERMPLIDRAQAFDVDRPVHDVSVDRPLEYVGEKKGQRHREPFQRADGVYMRDINIECRGAHRVDDHDMNIAVIPAEDARAIFLTEADLPLADHRSLSLIPVFWLLCALFVAIRPRAAGPS